MFEGAIENNQRVLIVTPGGRDADLTHDLLLRASIPCIVCGSVSALCARFEDTGGGAILLSEEALDDPAFPALVKALDRQPAWSDVPVLLCAGIVGTDMPVRAVRAIETL